MSTTAERGGRKVLALGAFAAVLAVAATASAAFGSPASARPSRVAVYFVRGEQLQPVSRTGTTALDAVRQLMAGPTRAERARGFRTYVPRNTRVRSLTVADGLATVDLTQPFVTSSNPDSMLARLSELVHTLTGLQGTKRVQLLIDGAPTAGMFPGVSTSNPITLRFLETPNVPVPVPPEPRLPAPDPAVKATQQRLIALGYLLPVDDDGRFGPATQNAIIAFQEWEGLDPTPPGSYRVYAKISRWWSVPFREWLPYALPFVGGIAFHEFGEVPAYPASHGCVRQSSAVASWTYHFAYVGMPVRVIAGS